MLKSKVSKNNYWPCKQDKMRRISSCCIVSEDEKFPMSILSRVISEKNGQNERDSRPIMAIVIGPLPMFIILLKNKKS